MKRLVSLAALLLLFAPLSASAQPVESGQSFTGRVVSVTDGDTYDVRRSDGQVFTIRLHGVDAPETSQPYGTAATRKARQYVGEKNVRVTVEDIGRYGRAVASVEVQGGSLGQSSSATNWRGTTENTPQTPRNWSAWSSKRETPTVAYGRR